MRGISEIQIPAVVAVTVLRHSKSVSEPMQRNTRARVCNAGLQTHGNHYAVALQWICGSGSIQIANGRKWHPGGFNEPSVDAREIRRSNAQHRKWPLVQINSFPGNVGVSAKTRSPQRVTQHDGILRAIRAVIRVRVKKLT